MTESQIIVLATPAFLALIGIEFAIGRARGRDGYRLSDALSSIGLGVMSRIIGVFTALLTLGIYLWTYDRFALWQLPVSSPWTWLCGLVAYDFLYYWHHRAGHRVALFWAAHVVHHQSEDYNLSTALRQTSSGWLAGWIFYLPMALAGFPPLVFGVVALIDLLYQFWVHTEQVDRLGWFDRWFCAPSNHRVHHVPEPEGARIEPGHAVVGRRAADARGRAHPAHRRTPAPARRDLRRPGAGDRAKARRSRPEPARTRLYDRHGPLSSQRPGAPP